MHILPVAFIINGISRNKVGLLENGPGMIKLELGVSILFTLKGELWNSI